MTLQEYSDLFLPAIEKALQTAVFESMDAPRFDGLREMMAYHLGWEGEGSGPGAQGKRIRPQILLLCSAAAGGDWRDALQAAAAVELIHNFSLIHDDIEDRSGTRHGRPTVWAKWGEAQAVNLGDAMFSLAFQTLSRISAILTADQVTTAVNILQNACFELTQGQFLDILYETSRTIPFADYWAMVGGKTAALLAGCAQIGGLVGGADEARQQAFYRFGHSLGLAFQAQDDALGIWGDAALLGKSTESDLMNGKKTLPVVFALEQAGEFSRRWLAGPIRQDEVAPLAELLRREGAEDYTLAEAKRLTQAALQALDQAAEHRGAGAALQELAQRLLRRGY
jgi:geranylgeranyl diphosphate synthase type I